MQSKQVMSFIGVGKSLARRRTRWKPSRGSLITRQETASSSTSSSDATATTTTTTADNNNIRHSCDVVQGPSLLRTSATVHRPRPSLLFLPGLRSLPFWTQWDGASETNRVAYQDSTVSRAVSHLQDHCETILAEYKTVAPRTTSDYQTDTEHSLHEGTWDWRSYMLKGKIQGHFVQHFPETAAILQALREDGLLFEGTPFGYTLFSTLHGGSKIAAHSAPMNLRLRVHLPLIVPDEEESRRDAGAAEREEEMIRCGIRVGPKTQRWTTGKALVLDDSYDHEVWNQTTEERVLLLVDLWHPDVLPQERRDIVDMFQRARQQGWWSNQG